MYYRTLTIIVFIVEYQLFTKNNNLTWHFTMLHLVLFTCISISFSLSPPFLSESFAEDVIKKVEATVLLADGKPTLHAYRTSTIKALISHRKILSTQPEDPDLQSRIQDVVELSKSMASSSGRTALDKNHKLLHEGTRITAMWKGGETWYGGHVDYVNEDGTYSKRRSSSCYYR